MKKHVCSCIKFGGCYITETVYSDVTRSIPKAFRKSINSIATHAIDPQLCNCSRFDFTAAILNDMGGKLAKDKKDKIIEDDFVEIDKFSGGCDEFGDRKGEGVYCYQNGDIYDGDWKKGKKHGYGIYTYANGKR